LDRNKSQTHKYMVKMVPLEGEFKLYEIIPDDPLQFIYKITMGLIRIKLVRIAS
ncbi:unnamed protein product, partial [Tenebrio molitor]